MIDRQANAEYIVGRYLASGPNGRLRKGWTKLGSGAYRTAYLGPDGLVYKVPRSYDTYGNAIQSREAGHSLRYRGKSWAPVMQLLKVDVEPDSDMASAVHQIFVVVTERLKPSTGIDWHSFWNTPEYQEICEVFVDTHGGNYGVRDDGTLAILDMGETGKLFSWATGRKTWSARA